MRSLAILVVGLLATAACGSDAANEASSASGGPTGPGAGGASTSTASGDPTTTTTGAGMGGGATSSAGSGGSPDLSMGCKGEPPSGATLAQPPKAYSGGTCPMLPQVTTQDIELQSGGNARKFWLVVPANLDPTEHLPVIFLWHWLGGDAQGFFEKGEVQAAVDAQRFIAVLPQKKGDLQFVWPYSIVDSQGRLDEEATFFDDMLSCVSAQFNVNENCVSSSGVSAGALWTDQLVGVRGDWIASFMSLSGGTGGAVIKPWTTPQHKMPGFVLWGGDTDNCFGIMNFVQTSHDLEQNLATGGHFFLECIHNCGHSVPPFEPPAGSSKFTALWQFALDHPFWLKPGQSPYSSALPGDLPPWCAIGEGNATPATGECPDEPGC